MRVEYIFSQKDMVKSKKSWGNVLKKKLSLPPNGVINYHRSKSTRMIHQKFIENLIEEKEVKTGSARRKGITSDKASWSQSKYKKSSSRKSLISKEKVDGMLSRPASIIEYSDSVSNTNIVPSVQDPCEDEISNIIIKNVNVAWQPK